MTCRIQATRERSPRIRRGIKENQTMPLTRSLKHKLIEYGLPTVITLSGPVYGIFCTNWQEHPYISTAVTALSTVASGIAGLATYHALRDFYQSLRELEQGVRHHGN